MGLKVVFRAATLAVVCGQAVASAMQPRVMQASEEVEMASTPPLSPATTERVAEDLQFVQDCESAIKGIVALREFQLGRVLVTSADQWGMVLRRDFIVPNLGGVVNRVVCWRNADRQIATYVAIGQDDLEAL